MLILIPWTFVTEEDKENLLSLNASCIDYIKDYIGNIVVGKEGSVEHSCETKLKINERECEQVGKFIFLRN